MPKPWPQFAVMRAKGNPLSDQFGSEAFFTEDGESHFLPAAGAHSSELAPLKLAGKH